ncbi:MAG: phenylalanine--tRNA ligase subunit alpha [Dehalococcoidales bacterium]|nr:phenylalanine--tRNA ligase subunit alpha [Dehalococcoidales bacterium]
MLTQLEELKLKALQELDSIKNIKELEAWRVRYLGKKSDLTNVLRSLATLPIEERKSVGATANKIKTDLESSLDQKGSALRETQPALSQKETIDITLPGRPLPTGRLHPVTQTIYEACDIFASMGFQVVEGPDVEWNYYNFEALNIPMEHPARDTMSTFWIDAEAEDVQKTMLLRTHTTSVTARVVETMKPPIRVIEPGKVYRYEASDATHVPMFHQIDGLVADKGITLADLKGTLYEFARRFFGEDRKVRFRCDYFPFVEPGVEMAIECLVCGGKGCRLCGNSGWIEILGAGMTHPNVLQRGGIDPGVYTSFAFGMGVDRLPMLRYGIDDVRLFYGSDLRFLKQF